MAKYFQGINIFLFFKNKHIFEKTCTIICLEITFCKSSYHIETTQLIALQISWPSLICYDFLLKGVSEQTLNKATVIDLRIILISYDLNSPKQGH